MKPFYGFYFCLSVFLDTIAMLSANYIYQDLKGSLTSTIGFNFSIFIHNFDGLVFYGVDSKNKVLLQLQNESKEGIIFIQFNNVSIKNRSEDLCGCSKCSNTYLTVIMHLDQSQVSIQCNTKKIILKLGIESKVNLDVYPQYHLNQTGKTNIWMGNIGPHTHNFQIFQPFKSQLMGCIDKFYFNGKLVNSAKSGKKFKSSCNQFYNKTISNGTSYIANSTFYNLTDNSTLDNIYKQKIFLDTLAMTASNGIYQELNGSLTSPNGFNFSIFISDFDGLVFYGIDSNNQVLMQLHHESDRKIISIQFNKFSMKKRSEDLCGCSECSNTYLTVIMHLDKSQVATQCNTKNSDLKIEKASKDNLDVYPKYHMNQINKTFIWMGNIGGDAHNYQMFLSSKIQLNGCVDKLYFNAKQVNLTKSGKHIKSHCKQIFRETICNKTTCFTKLTDYDLSNCSIAALKTRYCRKKLVDYSTVQKSHKMKNLASSSTNLILTWKTQINKTYCLMDIRTSEQRIFFLVNEHSEVVMNHINTKLNLNTKTLTKISRTSIIILIVNFTDHEFIVKMSNGEDIYTYTDSITDRPVTVNIGYVPLMNVCATFVGLIDFQTILISSKRLNISSINTTVVWIGFSVLIFAIIFIIFLHSQTRYNINQYCLKIKIVGLKPSTETITNISMPIRDTRILMILSSKSNSVHVADEFIQTS